VRRIVVGIPDAQRIAPAQPVSSVPERNSPSNLGRLIGARYQVINQLGRGGMGTVYRVVDRLSGRVATLKRLGVTPGPESIGSVGVRSALAREFRLLSTLRHPNVVSVLDYGFDDDGAPFLTMDLEENAQTIVEAGTDAAIAVQVELLVQTLRALVYLHGQGIIHRDLKPDNILFVRGQVKVLDFGLSISRRSPGDDDGTWAGTPAYMAPELLAGGIPTEQSDLYALGMVAYEMLLGRHPLAEVARADLYEAVTQYPLPNPCDALDVRLRSILERLLHKRPAERFGDARAVIGALAEVMGYPFPTETVATRESMLQTAPLVGRDGELARLEGALREALRGHGSTWLVGGESGVGKSRVLDELRTRAVVEGAVALRGQAVSQGGGPYQVWRDVVGALALRADIADSEAAVLRAVVPNMSELLGRPIDAAPLVDSETAQTRLLRAVEELLHLQRRPVTLILEDLHWAGSESLKLLAWLVPATERLPLLIVGSYRDDEAMALPELIPGASRLSLRRLTRSEITEVAEAMIGSATHGTDLIDLLMHETEGIPFFIVEVMRTLSEESGGLDRVGTGRVPSRVVSGGMQKVIRRRLARMPDSALQVLRSAAIVGRAIDPAVLRALHPDLDVEDWTGRCARHAVLDIRDQQWVFAHDKLREQLVEELPANVRRALHRAVAETLEQTYPDRPERYAALAHHWREAGDTERESQYAREAGVVALQTGACHEAATYFLRARELTAVTSPGTARHRRGVRALIDPNEGIHAEEPTYALATIEAGLSEAFYRLGDLGKCREHSERALRLYGQPVPNGPMGWAFGLTKQLAVRAVQAAGRVRSRHLDEARRVAGEVARVQLRLTDTFFYALRVGPIVWSTVRVVNQCEPPGPLAELAQGYVILALLTGPTRATRVADALGRHALAIADRVGSDRNVAWVRSRLAVHHVGECRWDEATACCRHAAEVAERVGDLRLWEEARAQEALVDTYSARHDAALALFRDVQSLSRRTGSRQMQSWALMGEGAILSRQGQDREAIVLTEHALGLIDERALKAETLLALGTLGLARLRGDDLAGAFDAADRAAWHLKSMPPVAYWMQTTLAATAEVLWSLLERRWQPTGGMAATLPVRADHALRALHRFARRFPLGRPHAALWQGLASWVRGRPASAFRHWHRAIALAERYRTNYECARAHLEIGRHLDARDLDRRQHLHRAEELFLSLGCSTDASRARALIVAGISEE
jgi:tetratricopeptide (TPR) repeat protein